VLPAAGCERGVNVFPTWGACPDKTVIVVALTRTLGYYFAVTMKGRLETVERAGDVPRLCCRRAIVLEIPQDIVEVVRYVMIIY
jgi:hypothetical protein